MNRFRYTVTPELREAVKQLEELEAVARQEAGKTGRSAEQVLVEKVRALLPDWSPPRSLRALLLDVPLLRPGHLT